MTSIGLKLVHGEASLRPKSAQLREARETPMSPQIKESYQANIVRLRELTDERQYNIL